MAKVLTLLSILLFISCRNHSAPSEYSATKNLTPFEITSHNMMVVTVTIDTVVCRLLFDTGGAGLLTLDKSLVGKICPPDSMLKKDIITARSGFSIHYNEVDTLENIHYPVRMQLGGKEIVFSEFQTDTVLKKYNLHGILSIPPNSNYIWDINFEYNHIQLHNSADTSFSKSTFTTSLKQDKSRNYQITIPATLSNGTDSITFSADFLVDTGNSMELVFNGGEADINSFLNKKIPWHDIRENNSIYRNYPVMLSINSFLRDTIYATALLNRVSFKNMVGLNFLKRFNLKLDIAGEKAYLDTINYIPIKTIYNSPHKIAFGTVTTKQGYEMVKVVSEESFFYKAGVRIGDIIISMNDIPIKNLNKNYMKTLPNRTPIHVKLLRSGEQMEVKTILIK